MVQILYKGELEAYIFEPALNWYIKLKLGA